MKITLNQKPMEVPYYTSLQGALNLAGIDPTGITTAVNGNVVSLVNRDSTILNEGDEVQVIEPFARTAD